MRKEDAIAETKFRLIKCLFMTMQERGLISGEERRGLLLAAVEKYHPMLGELEVNSIAGEKDYKG